MSPIGIGLWVGPNGQEVGGLVATGVAEPPSGRVRIASTRGEMVTFLTPTETMDRGGGVGGWEASARPLRRPAHYWSGTPDDTISLPVMWDEVEPVDALSIDDRLRVLYQMGRPVEGSSEPPGLRLYGDVPRRDRNIDWKLDDIAWGAHSYDEDHNLIRLQLTLALSRLTEATELESVTVNATRDKEGKRRQRTVRTRRGDTLRSIAVRYLGNAGAWKDIRTWNPRFAKTDPDVPLKADVKVVLK